MRSVLTAAGLGLLQLLGWRGARAESVPEPTPTAEVSGYFALDRERWMAVDALAIPLDGGTRTLLVFSERPFSRPALVASGTLSRGSVLLHQKSTQAVTLSLLLDAEGKVLRSDYGRNGAELDSPFDYAAHLQLSRFDRAWIEGRLAHDWIDLKFRVPVTERIVIASESATIEHPAAVTLQRLLTALHTDDVDTWIALAQPLGYTRTGEEAAELATTRKVLPELRRIEAVRLDGERALVDFVGSKGKATAVMEREGERWMLQQISPR